MRPAALIAVVAACGGGLPQLTSDAAVEDASTDAPSPEDVAQGVDADMDVPTSMEASTSDRLQDVNPPPDAGPPYPPPQGVCGHSLCATGGYLEESCDTDTCTTLICDPSFLGDTYCCTQMWDMTCVDEVATECPPYHCN